MAKKIGTNGRDVLVGTNAADQLIGLNGDDVLKGRGGNDVLRGGNGDDTLHGSNGNDRLYGDKGDDKLIGGNGDDREFGDRGDDNLAGGAGNDRLDAGKGIDILRGGAGNDVLKPGDDRVADVINGGDGIDTVDYSGQTAGVDAYLLSNFSARGAKGDSYFNVENVVGSAFDDILQTGLDGTAKGNAGNDVLLAVGNAKLYGGTGSDYLYGGAGNDLLDPGSDTDADHLYGGAGIDTVDYSGATAGVTAYLKANTSGGAAVGDTYAADIENVIGSSFGDFLQTGLNGAAFGGLGDDTLYGAFGTDKLRGDEGADLLRMDYGNSLAWVQLGKGADVVQFFEEGGDKFFIDLSEFGLGDTFDSGEIVNSNAVTAVGTNAQFIYEDDARNLWFDANGTDAGGLTLIAQLANATINNANLGTNDFEFQL